MAAVLVLVCWWVLDFLVHRVLLEPTYAAAAELWRPPEQMKLGVTRARPRAPGQGQAGGVRGGRAAGGVGRPALPVRLRFNPLHRGAIYRTRVEMRRFASGKRAIT